MRSSGASPAIVLFLIGVACLPDAGCRAASEGPPNVIVLLVDTLRADYLGAYGFAGPVSPNLDRLAAESFVFEHCFAQSPWTKPSIATLFTSLDPQVHGLTNHEGRYWGAGSPELRTGILADEAATLAESFRAAGWETAAFVSNPWIAPEYGFAQGFDLYDAEHLAIDTPAYLLTHAAQRWLRSRQGTRPFFLYMHFMDVHAPYRDLRWDYDALPAPLTERRLAHAELPTERWENIEVPAAWATDEQRHELGYWRRRYAAGVRAFDRRIGSFLERLREAGILERSWLVVTSDHGEELFEHGDWSHGQNLYEHQLHVPLLVRDPHGRGGGKRFAAIVELVDVMPTLLALVGVRPPESAAGRDLSPLFRGGEAEIVSSLATATQRDPRLYSLRTDRHKLIHDIFRGTSALYDLEADPGEQRDRAAQEPETTDELRQQLLERIQSSLAGGALTRETTAVPTEIQERLRALGYLD